MALSLSRLALLGATLCLSLPLHANVPDASLIEQGKYVAQLGDCIACHTARQGKVMAGGLELAERGLAALEPHAGVQRSPRRPALALHERPLAGAQHTQLVIGEGGQVSYPVDGRR